MNVTRLELQSAIDFLRKSKVIRYNFGKGKGLAGWVRIPRTADTTPVDAYDDEADGEVSDAVEELMDDADE